MAVSLRPLPLLLPGARSPEPGAQACQGCAELRAFSRQEGARESSHGFPGGPMDSVSWLLPGAHISQTEDGAGPLVSPQWSRLPAGTHCQCPSAAPLEPTVGAEKGWGPPSHGSWFRAFHQECLRSGREGTQREGPRGGSAPPSWCGLVSFTADRPEVPDLRGGGAQPPRSIGPLGPRTSV